MWSQWAISYHQIRIPLSSKFLLASSKTTSNCSPFWGAYFDPSKKILIVSSCYYHIIRTPNRETFRNFRPHSKRVVVMIIFFISKNYSNQITQNEIHSYSFIFKKSCIKLFVRSSYSFSRFIEFKEKLGKISSEYSLVIWTKLWKL